MTQEAGAILPATSGAPLAFGQIIGERYRVGEVLGGGGMGVVCAGTHVLLGTPVAIKLIHSELKDDPEAVQRFVTEARATAGLRGEHIARVFDAGVLASGEPYLVMEQLEGLSLDQYLQQRGALSQSEAIDVVLQVCEGLAEAHAAALVHRDIKPANLFLTRRPDGQFCVKILDFGIVKQRVDPSIAVLTDPGKSLGSPWYMSPEQMLTPSSVDERADVWSLGVLLFELLVGRRPFDGESVPQVCANVLTASPPPVSYFRRDLAPELDPIVLRCLEKEPARRFRTVSELARALLPFTSAAVCIPPPAEDAPVPSPEPLPLELRRPPSYGSLPPLHLGSPERRRRSGGQLASWLVVLSLLLFGGWLQYRDPTLWHRALRAFNATHVALPWDPRLGPDMPAAPLQLTREAPTLLQTVHAARAAAEIDQAASGYPPVEPNEHLTPQQVQERIQNYQEWLRAQGMKRLDDSEF